MTGTPFQWFTFRASRQSLALYFAPLRDAFFENHYLKKTIPNRTLID
ncbi:MAG: hypothetical protein VSS75_007000 [Candidatus Parabeggiatoa sp.]|nr:hypothetical protein [Candidatus Parabeggiatoa sp.]